MIFITNPTPDHVARMVVLASGEAALSGDMAGRYADVARECLAGRVEPENDAAAAFLLELQTEAEKREANRVATLHAKRAATAATWADFEARRAAASAPPPGVRVLHIRDELTRELVKLHIPVEFFQN